MNILTSLRIAYDNRFDPKTARQTTDFFWYGSIRLSAILLLVAICIGGWFFYKATSIASSAKKDEGSVETVSRVQLKAVLDIFRTRAVEYDSLKKGGSSIVDPGR